MPRIFQRSLGAILFVTVATATMSGRAQTPGAQAVDAAKARANAIKAATGAKARTEPSPPGDPCTALNQATVRSLFPAAQSGQRTDRLDDFAINECRWTNAAGDVLLILRDTYDDGTTAKDDAIGMADVYTGMKGKARNVRIETFPSRGVDNAAFVEARDAGRGIPQDFAFLQLRKGKHDIELTAPGLSGKDRSQALSALETLGRQAAGRL